MPILSVLNGSIFTHAVKSDDASAGSAYQVVPESPNIHSMSGYFAHGVSFNNDGSKAYLVDMEISGSTSFSISEYSLSTPYDLATSTYTTKKLAAYPNLSDTFHTNWNNDGTKIYVGAEMQSGTTDRPRIVEFNVSTPYDISTMSTTPNTYITSINYIKNLTWNNDGTKMFASIDGSGILEVTASTPYSLSGSTKITHSSTSIVGTNDRLWGIDFNKTGTIAFIVQSQVTDDKIWKLELSTPYDLTTSSITDTYITTDYDIDYPYSLTVADDYLIIHGNTNQNGRAFTYFDSSVIGTINALETEATMLGRAYIDTSDANAEYDYYSGNITILDNGTKVMYSGNYRDGSNNLHRDLRISTLSTAYDISTSSTASSINELENLSGYPMLDKVSKDHWISDDGMTLYVMFSNTATGQQFWYRSIYKFSLSSAWDITTVTSWNPTQTFTLTSSTTAEEAAGMGSSDHFPISFWFNNDGSKLFVLTGYPNWNQDVQMLEYPLSTPYDLSTAGTRSWHNFEATSTTNQVSGGTQFVPTRVEFNDDGTKLYGVFSASGFVVGITSWTLGTAWDISTLSKDAWEQDISDSYTNDSGQVLGTSSRGTFPTAFANDNFYIVDIYSSDGGLDTNPLYRWDVSNLNYNYSGAKVLNTYTISNNTSGNTVNEGDSVVFTITSTGIPDGSTVYWEVDPYSFTEIDDFDSATRSGTATFSNSQATVTVNVLNDILDESGENERFNLRISRNQNVYSEFSPLASSALISIGEVAWITLGHSIQTPGLAYSDTLSSGKTSKGMNSTSTVVSSHKKDDGSNTSSGEVYIYNNSTGALERTITNPNTYGTSQDDYFGFGVSISENYVIASAPYEDTGSGSGSGKAYVFNLSDGSLKYTLNNPNTYGSQANDGFGTAVALTDDYAVVGTYQEDSGTYGTSAGAAYIFDMSDGSLAYTLNNPDSEPGTTDWFGYSVALNENFALVGAPYESFDNSQENEGGKAYLYRLDTGALVHTIDNPGASGASFHANDQFGYHVALTNKHIVVSARGATSVDDSGTNTNSGRVDVFNLTDASHIYSKNNPAYGGQNDYFGLAVHGSDNFLIVGARDLDGTNSGAAYIYNINSGSYMTTISNPNTYGNSTNDYFGSPVSILDNGNSAIGAMNEDSAPSGSLVINTGALYIYDSVYPTPTGGYTYKAIGDRGLIGGASSSTYKNKIQYFDITTTGDASDFGTVSQGGYRAGISNGTRGYFGGGSTTEETGGGTSTVNWVTTSITSNAYQWTNLLGATAFSAGVSDGNRGVIFGGAESFNNVSTVMHYISLDIAELQGADFGDLALSIAQSAGAADATYGIKAGGYYSSYTRRIQTEKFTIQTTGSSSQLGDLTEARRKLTGTSNGTRALFAGGKDYSAVSTIDYLTIASDTDATDFGDLSSNLYGVSACSNETRAVFGGGYSGSGGNGSTALQYVSYDTPGTASSFGSLVSGTNSEGGAGLSGAGA